MRCWNTVVVAIFIAMLSTDQARAASGEIRVMMGSTPYIEVLGKVGPTFEKKTGIKMIYIDVPGTTRPDYMEALKKDGAKIEKIEMKEAVIDGKKTSTALIAMLMVLRGQADVGVSPTPFTEWSKQATTASPFPLDPSQLTYRTIGHGFIKVFAHKGVGVTELSLSQLEAIFTGKIKNWKEVGGKDAPVSWHNVSGAATREALFKKLAMGDKEYGLTPKRTNEIEELVRSVAATPGAVGYLPIQNVEESPSRSQIQEIRTPDIGRPIVLITKGKPSDDVLKLLNFIASKEGKALVE